MTGKSEGLEQLVGRVGGREDWPTLATSVDGVRGPSVPTEEAMASIALQTRRGQFGYTKPDQGKTTGRHHDGIREMTQE